MPVKLARKSPITGKTNVMELPTTLAKICQWEQWNRSPGTPYVQDFFSELSAPEREFVLTGIHPVEWDEMAKQWDEEA